ncbi:MAG: GNAT family N-acetyltransferase [Candidatus Bathyarchaeota archaeon]
MKKMMLAGLYKIAKSDVEKASLVLGRVFHDGPLMIQAIPDEDERRQKLPLVFEVSIRFALKYGGVYAPSDNLEGIAIILPYKQTDVTYWRLLRSGALRPLMKLGKINRRLQEILAPVIKDQKEILKRDYLYLQTIGVLPKLQGHGFGGKLLRAIIEYADNEEIPIYLETTEEDVKLYKRFGFQVLKKRKLATIDLNMLEMARETK